MIVVDTTVWVNLLNQRTDARTRLLTGLIDQAERYAMTDVIGAELLAAPERSRQATLVNRLLDVGRVLTLDGIEDMHRAAECMRATRLAGRTVRSMADCLIAAVCIRERLPLLHDDRDFDTLAELTDLQVVTP